MKPLLHSDSRAFTFFTRRGRNMAFRGKQCGLKQANNQTGKANKKPYSAGGRVYYSWSSYTYNCIRANARWSQGTRSPENKEETWVSFQELREEWKLFFNYWTASGREHWKPQYLELWSAGTHIGLGSFQEGGNLAEGHHVGPLQIEDERLFDYFTPC